MRLCHLILRPNDACLTILAFAIFTAFVFSACNSGSNQPDVNFEIDYGNFRLDLPSGQTDDAEREYLFYAGAPVRSFKINLRATRLATDATIIVGSGRGTMIETITRTSSGLEARDANGNLIENVAADGRHTTATIPGNVGKLRVNAITTLVTPPEIIIESVTAVRPASFSTPPVLATEISDSVTAVPLQPGKAVDLGFPDAPTTYYFSLSGHPDEDVDVALFGTGHYRINDPASSGFPITDDNAIQFMPRILPGDRSVVGFTRQRVPSNGILTFAVTNEGANPQTGHGRFVVLTASSPLQLSFPSSEPFQFLPGNIGIDYDSAAGTNGPAGGKCDCLNWNDERGVKKVGVFWVPVFKGGLPICYDGHPGMDFLLPLSFLQQQLLVPVNAAAPGFVLSVEEGNADTCFANPLQGFAITCPDSSLPANFVVVRQDDGLFAYYVHIRRDLAQVRAGDRVVCGERLSSVGSAGQSATSHLHFELLRVREATFDHNGLASYHFSEVRDRADRVDPFKNSLWRRVTGNLPDFGCN